jgi:dTDP-4-amino-4,6-dideoxygalactose transaminase
MHDNNSEKLAIHGGAPIRTKPLSYWPQYGDLASNLILKVLSSGYWTRSGTWNGTSSLNHIFSERFSKYIGVNYCVTTDHGSSALVIALRALGVTFGDEVILPGLTWVACASAILRVGAVPVLVDIDPDTLCISPKAVEAAITPRTALILVVHLYSAMAEMDELIKISQRHAIPIIEDCAHAHGACWNGRSAGSLTEIGVFSMQQGKSLTCGEGGAAVTSDSTLYSLLEQFSMDGRKYAPTKINRVPLIEIGEVIGANYAMSEFQAAVLIDGLSRIVEQNEKRQINARYLDLNLEKLGGLIPIKPYSQNNVRSYYHYVIRYASSEFANRSVETICRALEEELCSWIHTSYKPLNNSKLYQPHVSQIVFTNKINNSELNPTQFELPEAEKQSAKAILIHHSALLGNLEDMNDIITAFEKIKRLCNTLPV